MPRPTILSISLRAGALACSMMVTAIPTAAFAQTGQDGEIVSLPYERPAFDGVIGKSLATSTPAEGFEVKAPDDATNVLLILTDDVGFGAMAAFGGIVPTPNFDRLAQGGLQYNRFNVTAMCSPTRAALLTGRNPHVVGHGIVTEGGMQFPGYNIRPFDNVATIGRVLHDNGYDTAFIGKHHNIHVGEMSPTGPFDNWPTNFGFDYFYGFILGETDQFSPALYNGTQRVDLSDKPSDYLVEKDLADKAIDWIDLQLAAAPDKPFFMYYATGSTHAPHHAPKELIEKFRGQFDEGWDEARSRIFEQQKALGVIPQDTEMTPRPDQIPAWDSLTEQEKRVYSRYMEVYAAHLTYQDQQIGRVIDELHRTGEFEDTLIVFVAGDNGASMEGGVVGKVLDYGEALNGLADSVDWSDSVLDELGGPTTAPLYPAGWAWAMNTPYPWAKRMASYLGGTRAGMVVSWPEEIQGNGLRTQYTHVTDVMPTVLEAAGIPAPDFVDGVQQKPINGVSFAYSFNAPEAPSRHNTQSSELLGNRSIYHDGWFANTTPPGPPWQTPGPPPDVLSYEWELYNLEEDFAQANNVADEHPEKLREMQALFDREATSNDVYPLRNGLAPRVISGLPSEEVVLWGDRMSLPRASWPKIFGRSFTLTAHIETDKPETGVLASIGSLLGGWSFYLKDGKPAAYQTYSSREGSQYRVIADDPVKPGASTVSYRFDYDGGGRFKGGTLHILVDGVEVAQGRMERTIAAPMPDGETFDVGRDRGAKVSPDYQGHAPFEGTIEKIVVQMDEQ